jgi:putative ABC transport system permease protein
MGNWGPPLRIARRTTRRALGRTLLVAALIGLPVMAASWVQVIDGATNPDGEALAETVIGQADARLDVSPYKAFAPITNPPSLQMGDQPPAEGAEDPVRDPSTFDPRPLLPAGTQLARQFVEAGTVEIRGPQVNSSVRVTTGDGQSPLTKGTYRLDSGRLPAKADEVAVTPTLAKYLGILDGDQVRAGSALVTTADQRFTVVGIARTWNEPNTRMLFAVPDAPLIKADPRTYVRYLVDLPPGADPAQLIQQLNSQGVTVLPRANIVDPPPDPYGGSGGQDAGGVAVVALIIGFGILEIVLLAGTAFAVGARRQTRELGLVTAAGGTPRDVRRIVLAQGLFAGIVGSGGGIALALVIAFAGKSLWERITSTLFTSWQIPWLNLAVIALLGLLAGLAAAVIPAISAGRQAPLSALSGRFAVTAGRARIRRPALLLLAGGLVCAILGSGLIAAAFEEAKRTHTDQSYSPTVTPTGPIALVLLGITSVVAALIWLLPGLIAKTAGLAGVMPLSARLALRDAARHRHRTGPAAAAIMMAVAATAAMSFAIANMVAADAKDYRPNAPHGDAVLNFATGDPNWPSYSESTVERTAGLLPTRHTWELGSVSLPTAKATYGYLPVLMTMAPPNTQVSYPSSLLVVDPAYVARFEGFGPKAAAELRAGKIVVPQADQVNAGTAAVTEDANPEGNRAFRHPAAFVGTPPNVGQLWTGSLISKAAAEKLGKVAVFQAQYELTRAPNKEELNAVARLLGREEALTVERGYQSPARAWLIGLLSTAAVVTLLGVAISVSLSAAEGRADLATLAAIGAPPRRRRNLAAAQAWVLGQLGCVLGVGVGALYGYTAHAAFGSPRFMVPWPELGGIVIVVPLFAGTLAWLMTRSRLPMVSRID